ncbi:MAG: hypothetical protein KKA64_01940 [Nanoarchaeota archaeon]|nr:hypothetical protein [Nanoarchaeota archaeon]
MEEQQPDYFNQILREFNIKIRDSEEKQRIVKDRLLLIGRNMIEIKEKTNEEILEIKKELEVLNQDMGRMKDFLENASGELSKFAKKEDLAILAKQVKMFQLVKESQNQKVFV